MARAVMCDRNMTHKRISNTYLYRQLFFTYFSRVLVPNTTFARRKSFGFHGCEVKKTIFSDDINETAIKR